MQESAMTIGRTPLSKGAAEAYGVSVNLPTLESVPWISFEGHTYYSGEIAFFGLE